MNKTTFPNIQAELGRNGISRKSLALILKVSYPTIRNWFSGRTEIPSSKLLQLANIFHCSVDYLLGLTEERSTKGA